MRDGRGSPPGHPALQISPYLPLVRTLPFISHLFLAANSGITLLAGPKAKLGLGRRDQGARGVNLKEALSLGLCRGRAGA